ncbi:hypothetical protein FRX31_006355 [Thalictrum thalictroides]|uniref:KIB1-4 beta-propeller domain-containing protein n=1 Tax=Thalictrum thalictroides TaxID=46969 RepID=A0A7J6X6Q4_THATH|nr:hypothetical protein FRX31_006355 [Thalictrum thalictroides]
MFCIQGRGDRFMKVKFEVLKLDTVGGDWIPINNIGDAILFLGDNCSITRSAFHCPGCKPNSIYYLYDLSFEQNNRRRYGALDTGIYNLEDGTIQPHYPLESKIIFPQPIWFEWEM